MDQNSNYQEPNYQEPNYQNSNYQEPDYQNSGTYPVNRPAPKNKSWLLYTAFVVVIVLIVAVSVFIGINIAKDHSPAVQSNTESSSNSTSEADNGQDRVGGSCGANAQWELTADGVLSITGTGAMQDFYYHFDPIETDIPWIDYIDRICKIEIATGITSIGNWAFRGCSNLTEIKIPDTVTAIGNSAFWLCTGLTQIRIPSGVHTIGSSAFYKCKSLTELTLPAGLNTIATNLCYQNTALKSITIPAGVTSIGDSAFRGCSSLTDVYFGSSQAVWDAITINANNTPLTNAVLHITVRQE